MCAGRRSTDTWLTYAGCRVASRIWRWMPLSPLYSATWGTLQTVSLFMLLYLWHCADNFGQCVMSVQCCQSQGNFPRFTDFWPLEKKEVCSNLGEICTNTWRKEQLGDVRNHCLWHHDDRYLELLTEQHGLISVATNCLCITMWSDLWSSCFAVNASCQVKDKVHISWAW